MKIVLMVFFAVIPAFCAAEARVLTLDQAISIAMEKNRDIEKAREYAYYVQGKYVEERAAALPNSGRHGWPALFLSRMVVVTRRRSRCLSDGAISARTTRVPASRPPAARVYAAPKRS